MLEKKVYIWTLEHENKKNNFYSQLFFYLYISHKNPILLRNCSPNYKHNRK